MKNNILMESGDIKLINSNSIHKICSGQVVLSLGTAVKELVENSIDAGASIIDVKLKEYGSELIEVIDNGKGVHSSDFQNITLKHHTSKIKEFSDVQFVSTFGFRGEALSSLCALSDVEIVTCHYDSPVGTLLVYDHGGLLVKKSSTHRQVGTTVIVKNLFFTLPVRHKEFHRNLRREYAKMLQTLTAYCLISVKKKISCTNWTEKGRKTIAISSNCCDSYKDNILCIFGRKQVDSLIEFVQISPSLPILEEYFLPPNAIEKCNVFQIEGFVSNSCHGEGRSSTERQFFYVNGRPCDLPKVSKLINDVYHSFNKAQYPFVFLNINVMEGSADVNIVPDKRQIFLPDQKLLLCIIKASLHQMYQFQPSEMKISSVSLLFQKNTPDIVYQAAAQEAQAQAALKIEKLEEISQKRKLDTSDLEENSPKEFRMDLLGYKTLNSGGGHTQPVDQQKTVSRPLRSQSKVTKHSTYSDVNLLLSAKDKNKKLQQVLQKGTNSFSTSKACSLPELTPNVSAGANAEEEILDKFHLRRKKVQTIAFSIETIKRENKNMCKTKFTCDYRKFRSKITPSENNFAEEELKKEIKKEDFSRMDIIGQFNLGFIVTRLDDDLFIIDQHATDEKYNFETLQRLTVLETQKLLNPQNLNLTAVSETILIDNLHIFEKSGFGFSIDEDNLVGSKVQLVSVPVSQNWRFGKEDVEEMIFMLTDNPVSMVRPSRINQMFASRACRKSVMIGTALPTQAMKKLILHMGEIEQPWNCPHGRPTMRHLLNLSMLQSSGSQTVNKNLKTKTNNCL